MQPRALTLTAGIQALQTKSLSLGEVYASLQDGWATDNQKLNIYLSEEAEALQLAEQQTDQPLAGAPIAVKDNFCTMRLPTTASSLVLKGFQPPYESTVTERLQKNGGVIVGKTNMDAWAHGSSTETSQFGPTLNPRNPAHLPGGSSGGSAAAVAADRCWAAIGSETAGSIRQPSAWCGVVGLKPTYGRVSRFGVVAMASSTDSPGPIAKTVEDAALLLQQIAGPDSKDATCNPQPAPNFLSALSKGVKDLKIGLLYDDLAELKDTQPHLRRAVQELEKLGAHVEPVKTLDPHYSIGVYTVIQRAEVSSNLARYDGHRYGHLRDQFGAEAKRRIMLGTFTLSKGYSQKYYEMAQKVRTLYIQDFQRTFDKFDVLISLTSPGFAKKVGASEGAAMFGELEDILLEPSSISGLPGISVPCYQDPTSKLFLGMNIMAPAWREDLVIQTAAAFEQATNWNTWRQHE